MIGIYKITNVVNNKVYIGQSVDIDRRWIQHQHCAFWAGKANKLYYCDLYKAMREFGLSNFKHEVIEECAIECLDEREEYWIQYYNSFENGYNMTHGGENHRGESHGKSQFTDEEVYEIRELYASGAIKSTDAYELYYKDRIGESGFKKIWNGYTWKHIHMDVYTEENKARHKFLRNSNSQNNSHAKLGEEDVILIRTRKKNGESLQDVYKDYNDILTLGSFKNLWYGYTWKYIIV